MNSEHSADYQAPDTLNGVLAFRRSVNDNGLAAIRVVTGQKRPVANEWQNGDPRALTDAPPGERSTGIICSGLRVVDIDVPSPEIAAAVRRTAERILGPTIARGRDGSPRVALVYRAAEGEPLKQKTTGDAGKVEVLGRGQQLVADGIHPEGGRYRWENNRGPHNTKRSDLPSVTEAQIDEVIEAVAPIIGAKGTSAVPASSCGATNVVQLPGQQPIILNSRRLHLAAQSGDGRLGLADIEDCLLNLPNNGPLDWEEWNAVGMEIHVASNGDPKGEKLYEGWSNGNAGANKTDTAAARWAHYGRSPPNRTGGGALIARVRKVRGEPEWMPDGYALMASRNMVSASASGPSATTVVSGMTALAAAFGAVSISAPSTPFFTSVKSDAANLHPVSWLVLNMLIRGEPTVLAGQGGGAKTAFVIYVADALAAGRQNVGPFQVNTRPGGLRVAVMTAEEDAGRIGLLDAAARNALGLTAAERAAVDANLMTHDARESGWRLGEPLPGARHDIAPEADDHSLASLRAALGLHRPDLLILDTLSALFALPNENDNTAATVLMRRISRLAREADCAVLIVHHTPKMTRETAATQRGEPTLVRGGSAIVNSARVVLTITAPPAAEAGPLAMLGFKPEAVRRIEHAKINDAPQMDPAHFIVTSELVRVHDGTDHAVRAIRFITPPPSGTSGIPDALRNIAMKAVDAGVVDERGARVPLSPGGGKDNRRDGLRNIAQALMHATPSLAEPHAKAAARDVLKDLRDRIGCVVEQETPLPQYKPDGQPNGTRKGRGLVCRWDLAPWVRAASSPPTSDPPQDGRHYGSETVGGSAAPPLSSPAASGEAPL